MDFQNTKVLARCLTCDLFWNMPNHQQALDMHSTLVPKGLICGLVNHRTIHFINCLQSHRAESPQPHNLLFVPQNFTNSKNSKIKKKIYICQKELVSPMLRCTLRVRSSFNLTSLITTADQPVFYVLRTSVDLKLFKIYVVLSYRKARNTFLLLKPTPIHPGAHKRTSFCNNAC